MQPEEYIAAIADDKRAAFEKLRATVRKNIPKGFEESISYGMLGYVVPFSKYPSGYHCDPKLPVPFAHLAAQKNFIAIYHMGLYCDKKLLDWFTAEHAKRSARKLDMGKSCIRYKKPEDIPFDLIGELFAKMTVDDYLDIYTSNLIPKKK